MMLPITVIIPCFNAEQTLARALDSCLAQPQATQVVVVDDGSQDASPDIAARYAREHSRVEVLHMLCNGGAARARNWGALNADHPLLAFLDADDEYFPGALADAAAFIAQHPRRAAVRLDVDFCDFPPEIVAHPKFAEVAGTLSNTVPSSLVIHRPVFSALGGFPHDEVFRRLGGEDGALALALLRIFDCPRLIDRKRVRMHYHPSIHAERFFRIAMGMQAALEEAASLTLDASLRYLHRARAAIHALREFDVRENFDRAD